jgi:hypothetical protein
MFSSLCLVASAAFPCKNSYLSNILAISPGSTIRTFSLTCFKTIGYYDFPRHTSYVAKLWMTVTRDRSLGYVERVRHGGSQQGLFKYTAIKGGDRGHSLFSFHYYIDF